MTCDPKFRKVLVTDGKSAVGQASWLSWWRPAPTSSGPATPSRGRSSRLARDSAPMPQVTLVPLDVTDERSVQRACRRDRRQGRHRDQQRRASSHLRHLSRARHRGGARRDGDQLLRPAAAGAGVRPGDAGARRRRPASACAWVNLLSIYALVELSARTAPISASKAAAHSLAHACAPRCCVAGIRVINVFPGPIDDEWNQLAAAAEARARGARARIVDALARRRRGRLSRRRRAGVARALARQSQGARARARDDRTMHASSPTSWRFTAALAHPARIRVVDLTQTLSPDFPQISLPPEIRASAAPFRIEEISRYDERGPAWYWNNFSCGEHTGTHFDAPIHWISGRDLPEQRDRHDSGRAFRRAGLRGRLLGGGGGRCGFPAHRSVPAKPGRRGTAASRRARGC